ncbi:sister chromatid cohesion protein PDS5 homolog A-like isoform X2 [Nymphaea colorata]|uniref:sister chromatid cohesion protein PDS5 homolog A-like isoform X2 n=1 Tax=Nymphaea colorata TaxID=210225 RepID=UPI00129EAE68|nr:sister chromatid cohesion protein PDS5 homolog A-like isoform X2 [Nymphaea colorata]
MAQNLRQALKEIGSKLANLPHSKDSLVKLLKQATNCLSEIDQSPPKSLLVAVQSCADAVAKAELLAQQDRDVRLLVSACICEIMRITAPVPPYNDDVLRDAFRVIVGTFSSLDEINSPSFGRMIAILETLAKYRSCVVMLDLECNDLVNEMFSTFLSIASNEHPEAVLISMQTIMVLLVDESEDVQEDLLLALLSALGQHESDISSAGQELAISVIEQCAGKLEPYINQFLISAISRNARSQSSCFNHHEIIYDIYRCSPQFLRGVTPYMLEELLANEPDVRLKSVNLLGWMFTLPGRTISEPFRPLFSEFLKRLTDRVVDIRTAVVGHMKGCLLSNPFRPEAAEIISALCDRLLDYDESVREQVVGAICDVAGHSLESVAIGTIKFVAERLRDKSITVKKYTLERLVELYRLQCLKFSDGSIEQNEYRWLPGKILRCFYDKDLRYEAVEKFLSDSLLPTEVSVKVKVRNWIAAFSEFEKVEIKALEQAFLQKQRLQKEMKRYLALRKKYQDKDTTDILERTSGCIRTLARSFKDPAKAEEDFQTLNQLKDNNVWKILTSLLDTSTSTAQALKGRDDLLKILGDRHPLFDFFGTLTTKCSLILFNKEHIEEILDELILHKSAGNEKLVSSCLRFLMILASFFPSIFRGVEEQLVLLLKDDNETIKEGILLVLAKVGGAIRSQLPTLDSSVDLLLEKLCIEGTRKQAKYSVQALAAITIGDGLKSLSLLYKHLVDMLDEGKHLPAILQSLGYIAQIAMPIFETREEEIVGFLSNRILPCSVVENISGTDWDNQSKQCLLKIFAIKTLVKSYLPTKDALLRTGIGNLLKLLKDILSFGEVSQTVESSIVDKAHLRLASAKAILRLSRIWDHKIPNDVFFFTIKISQDTYPQVRKQFLAKVHQYVKDRLVDVKYAISLPLAMHGIPEHEYKEYRHRLVEIVEMLYREAKSRKLYAPSGQNLPSDHPEYILAYFVHALAHDNSFPSIVERPGSEAFVPIFWRLYAFLSVFICQDVDGKLETVCPEVHNRVCAIVSVFKSIKLSEDVVDSNKSKNSHLVCEIGLIIIRNLSNQPDNDFMQSIPLPSALYTPITKSNYDVNEEFKLPWLANVDLFVYFKSSSLQVKSASVKDEKIFEAGDDDGKELPLMKMMKLLKSKKLKKKKPIINTASNKIKNQETDSETLSMVNEMRMGNLRRDVCMAAPELESDSIFLKKEETNDSKNNGTVLLSQRKKMKKTFKGEYGLGTSYKRKASEFDASMMSHTLKLKKNKRELGFKSQTMGISTSVSSNINSDSSILEGELTTGGMDVEPIKSMELSGDSGPASRAKNKVLSSRKGHSFTFKGDVHVDGDANHDKQQWLLEESSKDNSELVGWRIKVWWPMDRQFYEGVVQSFDAKKRKYLIFYDDGDVEMLKLEKEKWERIDDSHVPKQAPSPSPSTLCRRKENRCNSIKLSRKSPNRTSLPSCAGESRDELTDSGDGVEVERHAKLPGVESSFEDPTGAKEDDLFDAENTPDLSGSQPVEDPGNEKKACGDNSDDEPLLAWKLRVSKGD